MAKRDDSLDELFLALEAFFNKLDREDEALAGPPISPSEFRIPCKPGDEVGWDDHKHLCSCGTCWKHSERLSDNPSISSEEFREAHNCPTCGLQVTLKHDFKLWKD